MKDGTFQGVKALVVGGAGFVGSNLVERLLSHGVREVTVVDNFMSSEPANIPDDPRVRFTYGSIADPRVLEQLPRDVDFAWHLACYHGNQASISDPFADHDNNTATSLALFEHLSGTSSLRKVVYAAAGCAVAEKTYGEAAATSEDAPISLFHDSPYSISKLIGELYGNYYFLQKRLPFVRARFQNVYGPKEILGAGQWRKTPATVWRNVTPTFIWRALHDMPLRLDNSGETSRDFIFVDDLCRGLMLCAAEGRPGEAYNLASGVETTIGDHARMIVELSGSASPLEISPARAWDRSGRRFGSTEKSRQELGFSASTNLREGLKSTIEWTRANEPLVRSCIDRYAPLLAHGNWAG